MRVVVANLVSHPALWFVLVPGGRGIAGFAVAVALAESVVVAGEAAAYAPVVGWCGAAGASVAANAASAGVGFVLAGLR